MYFGSVIGEILYNDISQTFAHMNRQERVECFQDWDSESFPFRCSQRCVLPHPAREAYLTTCFSNEQHSALGRNCLKCLCLKIKAMLIGPWLKASPSVSLRSLCFRLMKIINTTKMGLRPLIQGAYLSAFR